MTTTKKLKNKPFTSTRFTGKSGSDYVRGMIAPQDEKMYDWLNDRIRVGRFGTKQMTQFFDYALDNPTPEFYTYVMSKLLKAFGLSREYIMLPPGPEDYRNFLSERAETAKMKLEAGTHEESADVLREHISQAEDYDSSLKRYTRFCECFLHDEDWSAEQELEIGRKRQQNLEKQRFYREPKVGLMLFMTSLTMLLIKIMN